MALMTYVALFMGVVIAFMATIGAEWSAWSIAMALMLLFPLLYLAIKAEWARRQLGELQRLRLAYDQLDQQAKLVIRTDLELHRTQEELDRRLASLMSLHRLGRQLQVSLRPEEVFSKLDASIVTSFGFSKGLLGMCASLTSLEWRSCVGVSSATADAVRALLMEHGLLKSLLTSAAPQILDTAAPLSPPYQQLLKALQVTSVAVAGIMPHAGPAGCLILGRSGGSVSASNPDEELVAILANQLLIAAENSALYEKTWAAQRELERKVQERTRELADANAELVRLNKAKSDFVSAVSHELRTPLSAIKGYAALLGSGQFGPMAKPQQERITKVEKHADLLTLLINNLLDIARIESGRITMEQRAIPVQELFSTVQEAVHPQLEAKHLRYTVDLDGVKELAGDPQHLQRVFINLLSNAVKYTPDGGAIRVGLSRDGASVVATVSDTGCGIAPEDLPRLFQEFYRANDPINQQVRGTGLGLALVKRIVEAHRGHIWVTSEKGKGSVFHVSLPATPSEAGTQG